MHRARIVGQVERTSGGHFYELGQSGFACQVRAGHSGRRYSVANGFAELLFVFRPKDGNIGSQSTREQNSRLGETLRQPLLCGAKGRTGANANDPFAEADTREMRSSGGCRGVRT